MKRLMEFLIFFLIIINAYGERIDPLLKLYMINKGTMGAKAFYRLSLPYLKGYVVPVFIISEKPEVTMDFLKGYGYRFRRYGNVLSGHMDLRHISTLDAQKEITYISMKTPKRLYLDKSLPFIKGDLVHSAFRLPFAVTGKNVVLGITDTGLDYTHQDFISDDGAMRTRYIWYQDINPDGKASPSEFGYGDECDPERLESRSCPYKDIIGHGTHCSGIMGSDSRRYKGVAPDGLFVVAKSGNFENLVDGIEYIFKRAEEMGLPAVINMSLGGHYGPHDGRSPEELAIEDILQKGEARGKVIVVAAGNEGSSNIHLGYQAENTFKKTLMNLKNSSGSAIINLWRPKEGFLEVAIGITRDGIDELAESDLFDGSKEVVSAIIYEGRKYAEVYFDSSYYPPSQKTMYLIGINRNCADCISSNFDFYIKTKGDVYFDAWFADEDFFSGGSSFSDRSDNGLVPGDSKRTIGMPATSPYVITVAAAVSRKEYTDIDGNVHTLKDNIGDIAYFSSSGPTGDEKVTGPKPDVTAPGRVIISSFSSDAIQLQTGTQVDRFHIVMQGTSMACPHTSGLVALLLSINPLFTSQEIKRIIKLTASKPYPDFNGFDYRWGSGIINVYEAVRMAQKIGFCESGDDCREGMVCRNNYCRGSKGFECESNLDCDSGLVCYDKRCLSTYNGECFSDGECIYGLKCIENRCVYEIKGVVKEVDSEGYGCSCNIVR